MSYKIELLNISKQFPGVRALDDVSIRVRPGAVHALCGENGAGKSTLMKIMNGLYTPNTGSIIIDGQQVTIRNPIDAFEKGIAMIYQELNYFPELSVMENIYMGKFPGSKVKGFVNWKETEKKVKEMLKDEGLTYNPHMKIKNLSVSDIQMLEIIKAVSFNAKIIIMDEPTSAISSHDVANLFKKIKKLREEGISILYISHKMEEIFKIADDITVLRDGKLVTTGKAEKFTHDSLITAMVGRKMENIYPKVTLPIGKTVLKVKDLCAEGMFENINLTAKEGEIVGIAGLVGAGRTELARSLAGADPITNGEILIQGTPVVHTSISSAIKNGIIMVSEDRRLYGFVGCRSIRENISLVKHRISKGLFINDKQEDQMTSRIAKELSVKASNLEVNVETLSGGNQQKVVLAKWLLVNTKVLILDEPTRGIDVKAKYEIYNIITDIAKKGVTVIIISSELPELIGMSDRIYVMHKGHITGELNRDEFSQEKIMKYATGMDQ